MALIDANGRPSGPLPPISYLDIDKLRREEAEYQKHSAITQRNITAAAMPDPPPPYTYPASTNNSGPPLPSLIPPAELRRGLGEEQQHQEAQQPRQSLPSIHEALGKDQNVSYAVQPPTSAPAPSLYHREPVSSPLQHSAGRSYRYEQPLNTPSHTHMQPPSPSLYIGHTTKGLPPPQAQQRYPETAMRPPYQPHHSHVPAMHNPLPQSPGRQVRQHMHSYPPTHPYGIEHAPPHNRSMHPPHGTYPPYASQYTYIAPPPPSPSMPVYDPSLYTSPARYTPTWKSDGHEARRAEESKKAGRTDLPGYGESVKRHLDTFELEASLNEVLDFARHFGHQAHQRQRTGLISGTMPNLAEIDAMMKHGSQIRESLARMREVILTQQAALAERVQDYHNKETNDQDADDAVSQDDGKGGGFAGSDPKKRRGRAAPPGRCHSCNRAETPEWRRGPDGARTLCNACGLHYAKITRKMGNKPAAGGSILRPKSTGPGSPA